MMWQTFPFYFAGASYPLKDVEKAVKKAVPVSTAETVYVNPVEGKAYYESEGEIKSADISSIIEVE